MTPAQKAVFEAAMKFNRAWQRDGYFTDRVVTFAHQIKRACIAADPKKMKARKK